MVLYRLFYRMSSNILDGYWLVSAPSIATFIVFVPQHIWSLLWLPSSSVSLDILKMTQCSVLFCEAILAGTDSKIEWVNGRLFFSPFRHCKLKSKIMVEYSLPPSLQISFGNRCRVRFEVEGLRNTIHSFCGEKHHPLNMVFKKIN